jgi:hypothetical protein
VLHGGLRDHAPECGTPCRKHDVISLLQDLFQDVEAARDELANVCNAMAGLMLLAMEDSGSPYREEKEK